jgi:hypothetical protein
MRVELPCWLHERGDPASVAFDWQQSPNYERQLVGWVTLKMADFTFTGPSYGDGPNILGWVQRLEQLVEGSLHEAGMNDWDGWKSVTIKNTPEVLNPLEVSCEWIEFPGLPTPEEAGGEEFPDGLYLLMRGLRTEMDELPKLIEQLWRVLKETGVRTDDAHFGHMISHVRGDDTRTYFEYLPGAEGETEV